MKNKKIRVIIATAAALVTGTGAVFLFLKRRAKKRHFIAFMIAAVMLFGVMGASMTAYAASVPGTEPETVISETDPDMAATETEPDYDTEPDEVITGEETEIDIGDFVDPEREPNQFTPPGNLTLVDDLSGNQTEEKQFITVTTKNGNYFYIVIDRTGKTENVYFLNLVDEYDLLQILQGEDAETPPLPGVVTPPDEQPGETPASDEPTPQPKNTNTTGLIIMLVVTAVLGGGAFYYFKILKPKQGGGNKKPPAKQELDEFDFDPDEDDLFTDGADEPDGGDNDGETSDFTDADEPIPDFSFENTDFSAETPESEGDE